MGGVCVICLVFGEFAGECLVLDDGTSDLVDFVLLDFFHDSGSVDGPFVAERTHSIFCNFTGERNLPVNLRNRAVLEIVNELRRV